MGRWSDDKSCSVCHVVIRFNSGEQKVISGEVISVEVCELVVCGYLGC